MSTDPKGGKGDYRGGVFDHLDVPAITSFLVCALLFFLAVVGVKSVDYSRLDKKGLEDLPDRVARIIMPLKPLGQPVPKIPESARPRERGPDRKAAAAGAAPGAGASAAARIERSRKTVSEKIGAAQERITKAAVLSILSGKGPAAKGPPGGRAVAKGRGLVDFGGLEDQLANLEGLTKFDANLDANSGGGNRPATRDGGLRDLSGIDKMVKGFKNAKVSALSKIGMMELEKPELLERNSRYTGDRNLSDVGAFIARKQNMVTMLYEERLKINPTLEGKVTVVIVIEEDGTVSSATVLKSETTLDDPDFQAELLRLVRRWILPPSTGGPVEMKSPFVFKPA
jgi:TonB family protein